MTEQNRVYADYGLVSIIMSTYNAYDHVSASIDSIMAQEYSNWELLITDDCSTDDTMAILSEYAKKDTRIKIFKNNINKGAGEARNKAIKEAQGRFIAFCDSDDLWKPEKLSTQLHFMASKGIDICYSSYLECDENGNNLNIVIAKKQVTYRDIIKNDYIGFLTLIYDTTKIGKIFMPTLRKRQDWAMKILLLKKCPQAYGITDTLAYYIIRKDSLSRNKFNLVKYNIQVYRTVLHYNRIKSLIMFLFVFMPNYFFKKLRIKIANQ